MSASIAGFFTLGVDAESYHLPHPRLGLPVVLLIRRVLNRAFERLRERGFKLAEASEDEVTAALRSVIENDLRKTGSVTGFNRRTFETVERQGQVANFDLTKYRKSPDLCFRLRTDEFECRPVLSEFDALFVECKPVDRAHPVSSKYCDDGLIRFVCGDYGWAMEEGMMLAYARDGRTIAGHLIPAMRETKRMTSLAVIQLPEPCNVSQASDNSRAESVHISQHRRGFLWPDGKGPATDITIYHLWHDCG